MALSQNVDLQELAKSTPLFTGAELANVCREAAFCALRENVNVVEVENRHFLEARTLVKPGLTARILADYEEFDKNR